MATYYSTWKQISDADAYRVIVELSEDTSKSETYRVYLNYKLKIESANNYGFSGWTVGRHLKIGNTVAVDVPYSSSSSETMSVGENTITTIVSDGIYVSRSKSDITVSAYIETSTNAYYLPGKITLSGTYNTGWVAAGGGVVNSITDNCDNTFNVVATMGADGVGADNKVTDLSMWGFINKSTGDPGYSANGEGVTFDIHPSHFTPIKREDRTITYRVDLGSKLPSTPYMVRLRAYSLTPNGSNPGGTSVNSDTIYVYNFVTLLSNGGSFTDGSSDRRVSVLKDTTRHWSVGDYLPSKVNAEFKGYFTEPEGGIQVYNSDGSAVGDGTYFKGSGSSATWQYGADVTLYAQWKGNEFKVKIDGQWVDCNSFVKYNGIFVPFNVQEITQ